MRLTREILIEKQGSDVGAYFIMVKAPNPDPFFETTVVIDPRHEVQRDYERFTLTLIKIQLDEVDQYDLCDHQYNRRDEVNKIPVCTKR